MINRTNLITGAMVLALAGATIATTPASVWTRNRTNNDAEVIASAAIGGITPGAAIGAAAGQPHYKATATTPLRPDEWLQLRMLMYARQIAQGINSIDNCSNKKQRHDYAPLFSVLMINQEDKLSCNGGDGRSVRGPNDLNKLVRMSECRNDRCARCSGVESLDPPCFATSFSAATEKINI